MKLLRATLAISLTLALSACSAMFKTDSAVQASYDNGGPGGPGGLEGFRTTVYAFARAQGSCVDCHGSAQVPRFAVSDLNQAYNVAQPLVNFTQITASKFVIKVKDGHCGSICNTDGSNMVKLIEQWKASYNKGAPLGSTIALGTVFTAALPVPPPNPGGCNLPNDLQFSPDIAGQNRCWTKLRFPVAKMSPKPSGVDRAWLEVDFAYENYASANGVASYVVRNPRVVSPDVPIYVHDIKTFINGNYHSEYGEGYHSIDTVVDVALFDSNCTIPAAPTAFDPNTIGGACIPSVQPLFSTAASSSGMVQERPSLTNPDRISFSFVYFQKGIAGDCKNLALFDQNVYTPIKIGAVACLNCHTSKGQISEAGQRFNMDPNDPANGATTQDILATVCRRFLQRSNFSSPSASPIIVQPKQGLNGMPPQDNFDFFSPDWISWIENEASQQ